MSNVRLGQVEQGPLDGGKAATTAAKARPRAKSKMKKAARLSLPDALLINVCAERVLCSTIGTRLPEHAFAGGNWD